MNAVWRLGWEGRAFSSVVNVANFSFLGRLVDLIYWAYSFLKPEEFFLTIQVGRVITPVSGTQVQIKPFATEYFPFVSWVLLYKWIVSEWMQVMTQQAGNPRGSHKAEIKGSMLFQVVGRIIFLVVVGLKSQFPWHMIFFIFQPKQYILRFPASNSLFSLMLPARVGFLLLRAHVIWLSPFNNPG